MKKLRKSLLLFAVLGSVAVIIYTLIAKMKMDFIYNLIRKNENGYV